MSSVWVLTAWYNDYDQHGGYFVAWWPDYPQLGDLLNGNRVTVRWTPPKSDNLVDVHMVVLSVTTLEDGEAESRRDERYDRLRARLKKKGVDLDEEMYFIEFGESSK